MVIEILAMVWNGLESAESSIEMTRFIYLNWPDRRRHLEASGLIQKKDKCASNPILYCVAL